MTPCISEGKRGFSPERGKRPAISCDEELGGAAVTHAMGKVTIAIGGVRDEAFPGRG